MINGRADAVAAANYFHFTEHSVVTTKAFLQKQDMEIRKNSYIQYADFSFDNLGRLLKKSDNYLESLRFSYIKREQI